MVRKLRFSLCLGILFVLQAAVVHRFSYRFVRPDLVLLAAAYMALEAGYAGALGSAFAIGLLRDLGSGGRLGGSALVLVAAAAVLVALRERLVRESMFVDLSLAVLFVGVCSLGDALLGWLTTRATVGHALGQAVGQLAFTAALLPLGLSVLANLQVVEKRKAFEDF